MRQLETQKSDSHQLGAVYTNENIANEILVILPSDSRLR